LTGMDMNDGGCIRKVTGPGMKLHGSYPPDSQTPVSEIYFFKKGETPWTFFSAKARKVG
jgi:hypothetical protein